MWCKIICMYEERRSTKVEAPLYIKTRHHRKRVDRNAGGSWQGRPRGHRFILDYVSLKTPLSVTALHLADLASFILHDNDLNRIFNHVQMVNFIYLIDISKNSFMCSINLVRNKLITFTLTSRYCYSKSNSTF